MHHSDHCGTQLTAGNVYNTVYNIKPLHKNNSTNKRRTSSNTDDKRCFKRHDETTNYEAWRSVVT